jgi:hypothetical protein
MDLLFTYNQEKKDKSTKRGIATLNVFENKTNIKYVGQFNFETANNLSLDIRHELDLNIITGDFIVTYIHTVINKNITKTIEKIKKNDFSQLNSLVEMGMIQGENCRSYWGAPYKKTVDKISTIFYNKIKINFNNDHYNTSLFNHKSTYSFMYRLVVNYFLDKRNIKSHDGIYSVIETNFPAKKWLKMNDNNFLPALLESYGIKSKYLIKEINVNHDTDINLKTLKYICNLFGDNYIDYIKQIDWKWCSTTSINYVKKHTLETDHEKRWMVKIINELKASNSSNRNIMLLIYSFFNNVEEIKKIVPNTKFKYNNMESFYNAFHELNGILKHRKRGYRIKYSLPVDFVQMVEQPFTIDDSLFKPKILTTEEDFIVEGHLMKNCMAGQFTHGIIFIYISLSIDGHTVDLQYKNGKLIQSRGKANSEVDESFKCGINVLTNRVMSVPEVKWLKEKYDFI